MAEEKEKKEMEDTKLTFSAYLLMVSATGWQFLGKVPNPATGKIEKDLIKAKEVIQLLEILEEKTKNNLTKEEEELLKTSLTNLRLNYIDELKKEKENKKSENSKQEQEKK